MSPFMLPDNLYVRYCSILTFCYSVLIISTYWANRYYYDKKRKAVASLPDYLSYFIGGSLFSSTLLSVVAVTDICFNEEECARVICAMLFLVVAETTVLSLTFVFCDVLREALGRMRVDGNKHIAITDVVASFYVLLFACFCLSIALNIKLLMDIN